MRPVVRHHLRVFILHRPAAHVSLEGRLDSLAGRCGGHGEGRRVAKIGSAEPNPGKVPTVDRSNGNLPDLSTTTTKQENETKREQTE